MANTLKSDRGFVPNNSLKPNLLRYTSKMAGKACHVAGSATQVGLTQALGVDKKVHEAGAWKKWADSFKCNTYALYLAARDPRVPLFAKAIIGIVVAYALSPIDLIPDFIPVIGYLDDFLLLPLAIWLALRLVPHEVWKECQTLAASQPPELSYNRRAAAVIVIIWLVAVTGFTLWVLRLSANSA